MKGTIVTFSVIILIIVVGTIYWMHQPAPPSEESDVAIQTAETSAIADAQAPNLNVDAQRIVNADAEPGNWLSNGRTYSEQRYSPLNQINQGNISELGLAWYADMDTTRGLEATPIVVDGVMYTTSTWSRVYALDAASGEQLWMWDPQVPRAWGRYACCDVVNRGVAIWEGKLFVGTIDGRLAALDASTGEVLWFVSTIDKNKPYTITGAPRVVKGKVIIGNGGAEYGVRGYVSAYDVDSGEFVWRFYTIPGNPADGFESPAMEMAAETWTGEWWNFGGGGTAWDAITYDPDLNLIYIGVGNGSPWPRGIRSPGGGDNLFLSSIVAVDADTGAYAWHYQTSPGDSWDYTATQPIILADLEWQGQQRKVLMQAPKNGFFYVIDRTDGELLAADPFVPLNWATHVDMATGRPVLNDDLFYGTEQQVLVVPGPAGAHSWHPMAYSPDTGLVYIPAQHNSFPYSQNPDYKHRDMAWNLGQNGAAAPAEGPPVDAEGNEITLGTGALVAWNPQQKKPAWTIDYPDIPTSGVLTTAGNLVLQAADDGYLRAFRADNGEELWKTFIQTSAMAAPMTYTVDGEQYIALSAGWGGAGSLTSGNYPLDGHSPIAPGRLLVFKLGGHTTLPALPEPEPIPEPPPLTASEEQVAMGAGLYHDSCFFCHGAGATSGGSVRDLRHMAPATHEIFNDIVLNGAYIGLGMPKFDDLYTREEVEAIHAYLISRANEDWQDTE